MREYVELPPRMIGSQTALAGWTRKAFDYASSLRAKGSVKRKAARKPAGPKRRL